MRPQSLAEYVGQEHILGPGKLLRRAIEADRISSILLFGPPGTGKTTLAQIIAATTESRFERLSGVESTVADMRRVIATAANRLSNSGARTILFIDEIHRFNKAQQDVLLPDVESGVVRLIGATTHNPFFYINSPLVSRSQVFQLEPLTPANLLTLMQRAIADPVRGLGGQPIAASDEALQHLATLADGDARKCLNALEIGILTTRRRPME
jgi:putative ATPase